MTTANKEQVTSDELKALKMEEAVLSDHIKELVRQRQKVRQKIAEIECPFEIDEKIVNKKGEKAAVCSIIPSGFYSVPYDFYVRKFKKDGSPYKNPTKAWGSDGWCKFEGEEK